MNRPTPDLAGRGHNKTVAYKTVSVFAGLTKRKLWLRNSPRASTDGHEIKVPFDHPDCYLFLEEQLAHILFKTSAAAKKEFVSRYSKKVSAVAEKLGAAVSVEQLAPAVDHIITVLETRRVLSLWGDVYEGSAALLDWKHRQEIKPLLQAPHESLLEYFTCIAICPDKTPEGPLDVFREACEEAIRRVSGRGFKATLVTAKWLVMQLVDQLLKEARKPQPPPSPEKHGGDEGSEGDEGDEGEEAKGEKGAEGAEEKKEGEKEGEGTEEGGSPGKAQGPSGEDRAKALADLVDLLGDPPHEVTDTVALSAFQTAEDRQAAKFAEEAIASKGTEQELDATAQAMQDLIAGTKEALKQNMKHGDWLQQDAMAKVQFVDLPSPKDVPVLCDEDLDTVRSLRALFYRVMGRRRATLENYGTEIDIPAYLEQKLTGIPGPVFRTDGAGRGFRVHLLLDRSSSMRAGGKTQQCQRACRIIKRALAFPFVDLGIWGFSSFEAGSITLTRYDTTHEVCITDEDKGSGGSTPLHIALRLAAKELQTSNDAKQLIAITDGFPTHATRAGFVQNTQQLMLFTRDTVRKAKQQGVNVTGVILGSSKPSWSSRRTVKRTPNHGAYYDLSEQDLGYMFGPRKNWRCIHPDNIGRGLVDLVAASFLAFLRS